MISITHKSNTLRTAIAIAHVVVSKAETIQALKEGTVPKGNVFEVAKVAGLFAAKRTSDMIPDCHPLPIEFTEIRYLINEMSVEIEVEIHTIYKTGVEVEAMHAASVVALTMYDMLKPIDKGVSIEKIHLKAKTGGKSQKKYKLSSDISAAVIVCSDSISAGKKEDRAGKGIIEKLKNFNVEVPEYEIIPDEVDEIQKLILRHCQNNISLIIVTGGTGLSPRDCTPEAVIPLIDRRIPGIEEAIRNYGQQRTPYAMLSRSVVGIKGNSLIMALPGSTSGALESMDAVFPSILHVFDVIKAFRHD
jgi:molybdenum cofactor biosynthesis protein MoaC